MKYQSYCDDFIFVGYIITNYKSLNPWEIPKGWQVGSGSIIFVYNEMSRVNTNKYRKDYPTEIQTKNVLFFFFWIVNSFSNGLYYILFSGEIILTFHNTHSFQINNCFENGAFHIMVSHLSDTLHVICVHYFLMN